MLSGMQIVRASSPQQLLLALPHLAGAAIAGSVVLVPFRGSRTGMALRCDLPTLPASALPAWADAALAALLETSPDAVALVVVSDAVVGAGPLPHRAVVAALCAAACRGGVPVRARLLQAADAWGDYEGPDAARGPLAELEVTEGMPFLAPTPAPRVPPPAPEVRRRAVADALDAIATSGILDAALDDPVVTIELALHEAVLSPERLAAALAIVQRPMLRDVATSQLLDGMAAGMRAYAQQQGSPSDADAGRLLGLGPSPDRERVERGIGLVEELVAVAPDDMRAAPLTILASLHWLLGRSGTAGACVEAVLREEPRHAMASLLSTMLHAGMVPAWVAADRAALS